jgi:hypothetical protein
VHAVVLGAAYLCESRRLITVETRMIIEGQVGCKPATSHTPEKKVHRLPDLAPIRGDGKAKVKGRNSVPRGSILRGDSGLKDGRLATSKFAAFCMGDRGRV